MTGGLKGATLTFDASPSGAGLTILSMRITAPFAKGLHLDSPFFVIVPAKGPVVTDTVDGFPGTLDVDPGATTDFYGGSALLLKWTEGAKLKIVFNRFDLVADASPKASTDGCKAVAAFSTNAVPAFKVDLGNGTTCLGCHGGANDVAVLALDLSAVGTDDAKACAQALRRMNRADKDESQLLLTPLGDPMGDPSHPVKGACGDMAADAGPCVPTGFADGIKAWLAKE
jgi:hypothetical protein